MTNLAGWDRALRSNQGKPVQVTILRDKKQQTLTLQVDSKHNRGSLQKQEVSPNGDSAFFAGGQDLVLSPQQMEQWNQQMEEFRKSFNSDGFQFDKKQLDEFRHQMKQGWDLKPLCMGDFV